MECLLCEMWICGVKMNILFFINVMCNDKFRSGDYIIKFIEEIFEFFDIVLILDRGIKILEYIGNVMINGFFNVEKCLKLEYEFIKILKIF